MSIPGELFTDFLNCKYKAYLKHSGKSGKKSDFEKFQCTLLQGYQHRARVHLLTSYGITTTNEVVTAFSEIRKQQPPFAINVAVANDEASVVLDAIERNPKAPSRKPEYIPILFLPEEKITENSKLLLAFCGSMLAQQQRAELRFGKVIHGNKFTSAKVQIGTLIKTVNKIKREIVDLKETNHPTPLRLNSHCQICEFQETCYVTAKEKDDLSLLRALSVKEIEKLNKRGIFTVTQFSYTFRPRRAKKRVANPVQKHHHELNALAIRTQTIYISSKPEIPSTTSRLYLDVEGIPDENFYYLIGLLVDDGKSITSHYFWADNKSEEKLIWRAFVGTMGEMKDFVLFHYGSYETKFIKQMGKQYGGNSELLEK
ncbi:MAG: TM0106 family RecB-like putative nuclease, partial [Deltaproteobacteria bacterium]|nr:TM0106 family RecB-like putative nuclease [Deltaproteobacteria bacterium]